MGEVAPSPAVGVPWVGVVSSAAHRGLRAVGIILLQESEGQLLP